MKLKQRTPLYKSCLTQVKDIDEKGFVKFHASVFNTPDRVNDIVEPGAYTKTIAENFKEIQHYKNHDPKVMPGVIREMMQDHYGLMVGSKLILDTQAGKETYAEYKAMAEAGKAMGHSIGYYPVKYEDNQQDGFRHLKEIFLFEVSSLTAMAAHPGALATDVKSLFEELKFEDLLKEEIFYKSLLNSEFPEYKLEQLEEIKNHVEALILKMKPGNPTPVIIEPLKSIELESNLFTKNLELSL